MPGKLKNAVRWIHNNQSGVLRLWIFDENGKSFPVGYVESYGTHCTFWMHLVFRDLFAGTSHYVSYWQYTSLSDLRKEVRGYVLLNLWRFLKRTKELT